MKKLKDIDYKIISELMKNSKISDRKLAKIVGVSQPTVTRKRMMMEKEGLLEFTAIPSLSEFGFEIMAFSFVSWKPEFRKEMNNNSEEYMNEMRALLSRCKNIVFISTGRGLGMERICISLHKDYADYARFIREIEEQWGKYLEKHDTFIVSLKSDNVIRFLTFKDLPEYIKKIAWTTDSDAER